MIRFVDLSDAYWGGPSDEVAGSGSACCAFVDTVTDTFVMTRTGSHVFDSPDDLPEGATGDRCRALVPAGFFS